jgi:hypothetical protein
METYTLNRFYNETKSLLEKYHIQKEDYEFGVHFRMYDENNSSPDFRFTIYFEPILYSNKGYKLRGYGKTPEISLCDFEEAIKKVVGINNNLKNVSVEIPEEESSNV